MSDTSNITSVSGLVSGLDWRSMIAQLRALEERKVDGIRARQTAEQSRLSAWQSINTKFLSLKTATEALKKTTDFNLYTTSLFSSNSATKPEEVLSTTTTTDASPGTYKVVVQDLASAQKLSSTSFGTQTGALSLSGDILIGGRTVRISATDSLSSIRDRINAVNGGTNASNVTASIVNYGKSGYRLILTSNTEGAAGISLLNGGGPDLLGTLGFVDTSAKTAKNSITGGNKSDSFAEDDEAIGGADLLNLTSAQSGTVDIVINGTSKSVAIDLETDSLNTVRDAINTAFAGVFPSDPASVITENVDGTTRYRLLIEGNTISYTDSGNVLETLGVLKRAGFSDERGITGDVANTSSGSEITAATRFDQIDGYMNYGTGDTIGLSGTDTDGNAVTASFSIYDSGTGAYRTIGDLLTEINTRFGNVTAAITAEGKIQIRDNEIGDTHLAVSLAPSQTSLRFDQDGNFGALAAIRSRQIQAGADALITVDGVSVTPSSNTVDDVIPGVTLNLKRAEEDTTITVSVTRDLGGVKEKIQNFLTAYNDTIAAINAQQTYDPEKNQPGGPLFGDSTLRMIKSSMAGIILKKVPGISANFSSIGMVGISVGTDGKLTADDAKLQGYLETNFDDVKNIFVSNWTSTNSHISYLSHTADTQPGTYNLEITGVNPAAGYFVEPGDAEGNGEYLTAVSGDAEGLLVRYSGSETGAMGSLTLTFGVAELLNRSLYHITDSTNGSLKGTQEAIRDAIKGYDRQIARRETQIDRQMADLQTKFVAMETLLSKLQSQQNWLTGQINKL
jgi:flagellar hook-associated protein 2